MQHELIEALKRRYATQVYDQSRSMSEDDLRIVLESARLAPSAYGIEPWHFFVVRNPGTRKALQKVGFGQPKITDAPYLIVITYRTDVRQSATPELLERTLKTRGENTNVEGLRQQINGFVAARSDKQLETWAKAQAYIPLGVMIAAASLLGLDTGPMEGFDPDGVDEVLGLRAKNLHATSMLALGYRHESDAAAKRAKVRRNFDDVVTFVD